MTVEDDIIRLTAAVASMAGQDQETGLANLRQFLRDLTRELARAQRTGESLYLLTIECASEDDVVALARDLRSIMRTEDLIARVGAASFAILYSAASGEPESSFGERLDALLGSGLGIWAGLRIIEADKVRNPIAQPYLHDALQALESAKDHDDTTLSVWEGPEPNVH